MSAKNEHAVALGRLGARKGGFARKRSLSAKRRTQIARQAAMARWAKHKSVADIIEEVVRVDGPGDKSR